MRVAATKPVGWFTRGRQTGSFGASGPRRMPGAAAAGALPQLLDECLLGPFMGADRLPNEEEREEKELEECELGECELDERKELEDALLETGSSEDIIAEANMVRDSILPHMSELRASCDQAEAITAKEYWPYPSYGDLLFSVR